MAKAVTAEGVAAAIKALGKKPSSSILGYFSTVLSPNESIYAYFSGITSLKDDPWKSDSWLICLTQKKLACGYKPVFGDAKGLVIHLGEIKAVETKGIIDRKILLHVNKGIIELTVVGTNTSEITVAINQLRFGNRPGNILTLGWYSSIVSLESSRQTPSREPIPSSIQYAVWERDNGQCVKCGSTTNLQYDHIIPVSRGGGTSIENLQILCQSCNLRKSNRIGG